MLLPKFYELAVWERGVWGAPALPSNHKLSSHAPVHTHGNSIKVVVVDCSNIYYDSIRRNIRIQFTMYANLLILHSSTLYQHVEVAALRYSTILRHRTISCGYNGVVFSSACGAVCDTLCGPGWPCRMRPSLLLAWRQDFHYLHPPWIQHPFCSPNYIHNIHIHSKSTPLLMTNMTQLIFGENNLWSVSLWQV